MKKNNSIFKFAAIVLLITMVTLILVSGTYSKYTSSVTLTDDSTTVAKWSILVNDTEIAVTGTAPTIAFNLFDTINDTADSTDAVTNNAETNVISGKIAPGTCGSFTLTVANASEVDAKYSIDYTVTNTGNVPIEFSKDGGETWQAWDNSTDDVTDQVIAMAGANPTTDTITIDWRWAYDGANDSTYTQTDNTDTALGIAARTSAAEVTVAATITATQVN